MLLFETNKVHFGDCIEVMKDIPDKHIDMTVTSPPYDNLRTYENEIEWNDTIWKKIISELYRITKDGGVVVWVVGDATINGSETGNSFRQALWAKECGFNLHDTMIYQKPGFTAVGALKTRYAQVFEYMFVFSKGYPKTFNPLKDRKNKHGGGRKAGSIRQRNGTTKKINNSDYSYGEYGQRFNIWIYNPKTVGFHPAPFPYELAKDHIISWSNENDIIFDPFGGSGTTAIACIDTNRQYILCEKVEKYYNGCIERIQNHQVAISEEPIIYNNYII